MSTLVFRLDSAVLDAPHKAQISAAAAAWHATGGQVLVRLDGYASSEGDCEYNWDLSCRRTLAVALELEAPSDGSAGVPSSALEYFAHGSSDEAGPLWANRRVTISVPPVPPPRCALPVSLGRSRGCGSGADFTHFDFPAISTTSEAKLLGWALTFVPPRTNRHRVPTADCEAEMDGVLTALASSAGHDAFARFAAGTGGVETHGPFSTLGAMARVSGSFLATVAAVRTSLEAQLAAAASSGGIEPCSLAATPPATHFGFSDGTALKAVIGGTQGEELFLTAFSASMSSRTYTMDLKFVICDDFGVDESDLYAPGLFAFWVLQHERSATLYKPFINQLELPITISGSF